MMMKMKRRRDPRSMMSSKFYSPPVAGIPCLLFLWCVYLFLSFFLFFFFPLYFSLFLFRCDWQCLWPTWIGKGSYSFSLLPLFFPSLMSKQILCVWFCSFLSLFALSSSLLTSLWTIALSFRFVFLFHTLKIIYSCYHRRVWKKTNRKGNSPQGRREKRTWQGKRKMNEQNQTQSNLLRHGRRKEQWQKGKWIRSLPYSCGHRLPIRRKKRKRKR